MLEKSLPIALRVASDASLAALASPLSPLSCSIANSNAGSPKATPITLAMLPTSPSVIKLSSLRHRLILMRIPENLGRLYHGKSDILLLTLSVAASIIRTNELINRPT